MPVNPITGIVTYTLAEWKEESQLWERDGALRERERIINALYSKRRQLEQLVILSDDVGETSGKWFYQDRIKELDGYIALIKGENK